VPDQDYAGLVSRRTPSAVREGEILDENGRVIGAHPGHQHFTVGQRRGVPLALGSPVHVLEKNPAANTITVGPRERLLRRRCTAASTNWLIDPPASFLACTAKVRSNMPPVPARVRAIRDARADACSAPSTRADARSEPSTRADAARLEVVFDEPVEAIAPGQAVVCYRGDELVGGGWIDAAE